MQVAEKEPQNFMMSVVKKATVPKLVTSFTAFMEIKVIGPIKLVNSVEDIFACMRMHDIKEDCNVHAMGCVNEFFQLFRGATPRACGKEARNLISKSFAFDQFVMRLFRQKVSSQA